MDTTQIYTIVNSAAQQSMGESALTATDVSSLVSLGNSVLSSTTSTEGFLNALLMRIGKTELSYRAYKSKLADMVMDDVEFGGIVQKIKFEAPDAQADPAYSLTDGQSVDQYKVYKGEVNQKLFLTRAPYMFALTTQKRLLKEAFLSESAMNAFLSNRIGEVRNKAELAIENLGRLTIANLIAELAGGDREIKLITLYKAESGDTTITADNALVNGDFLRFCVRVIKTTMDLFTEMTTGIYNDGTVTRHTPYSEQRLKLTTDFVRAMETSSYWEAFNRDYISLVGFEKMNFWQSIQTRDSVNVTRASDDTATTVNNVVAVLHDRWTAGTYRMFDDVETSPINAAGLYYNTFWHELQLWFNDLSENAVIFTLS